MGIVKKVGQKIMANKDANETMFGYLKRSLTPGDEVKALTQKMSTDEYADAMSMFSGPKMDGVSQKNWDIVKNSFDNAKYDTNSGMYSVTRDKTRLEKLTGYFGDETHGTLRKTAAGAGIGAAAIGGAMIDNGADGEGGFGGAILGTGAAMGGMYAGIAHMAKKL